MINVVEFFSGIGGMHFALSGAGVTFDVKAAFDINTTANEVYQRNFPTVNVKSKNIKGMKCSDADKLMADLWTMSPPCQPFTRQGNNKDLGDNRTEAFQQLVSIFSKMEHPPKGILLENVQGFEKSEAKELFVTALRGRNFEIKEYLLNPVQFGIPNSRLRYYLLAWKSKESASLASCPEQYRLHTEPPISFQSTVSSKRVGDYLETQVGPDYFLKFLVGDKILTKQAGVLDVVTPDSCQCCCFTRAYTHYAEGTGSVLYTGDWNQLEQAFSVWSSATDEGEKMKNLKSLNLRYFTPREIANLMGFPSSLEFPDTLQLKHMYRLLGNSINVTVVSVLLKELLLIPLKSCFPDGSRWNLRYNSTTYFFMIRESGRPSFIPSPNVIWTIR